MSLTKATNRMIEGAYLNVLDYGAIGNGTADDTAAFQAAITAGQTLEKTVYVPSGTYKITSQLNINNNFTLIGDAGHRASIGITPAGSILDWRGVDGVFQTPGSPIERITVKNITILLTNNTNANHHGIWMEHGVRHGVFEDIHLSGVNANTLHGLRFTSASGLGNTSCYFLNLIRITAAGLGATGAQIYIEGGALGERYNNVDIQSGRVYGFDIGIIIKNSFRTRIYGTDFAQNDNAPAVGIQLEGELNREHVFSGIAFEPNPFTGGAKIKINNTDNSDSTYAGGTIIAGPSQILISEIVDTVSSNKRYTLIAGNVATNLTEFQTAGRPLYILKDNTSGSGETPFSGADSCVVNSNTSAGFSVLGPDAGINQYYAFGKVGTAKFATVRGRPSTSDIYLEADNDVILQTLSGGAIKSPTVYADTTASAANVFVSSDGTLQRSTSSKKYKTDIEPIENQYADALLALQPVWYRSTCSGDNPDWSWYGFIAEDVAEIDPRLVHYRTKEIVTNENGDDVVQELAEPIIESVAYDRIIPHLLNIIKRQQQEIRTIKQRLDALET
jgi:hypothetical protein